MLESLVKKIQSQDWLSGGYDVKTDSRALLELDTGDRIRFGAMQQEALSQAQCIIGTPTLFHFASTQLRSLPLFDTEFNEICSLIVAQVKDRTPYLAISKRINGFKIPEICTPEDFARIDAGNYPQHLYIRKHATDLQDWLHLHYVSKIQDAKGTKILPDEDVRHFAYHLYVAQEHYKAIEIERYIDGSYAMHATLFRPCSDIVELYKSVRKAAPSTAPDLPPARAEEDHSSSLTPAPRCATVVDAKPKAEASARIFTLPTAQAAPQHATTTPTPPSVPAKVPSLPHNVSCNLSMASRLIDEAMRSDMRVTDVMRKALGLSIATVDRVQFDLQLSEEDYRTLAERFGVEMHDIDAIHAGITEELGYFVGE